MATAYSEELINIGSGEEISIKKLVELLQETIDYKGEVFFNTEYPDGNPRKLLDSNKINSLGWKAETNIVNGLAKTYDWYLNNI